RGFGGVPALGALNVHDALLPRYAGFGAVNWAIRNGETETGLTVHFMDAELDTGPVVTQQVVKSAHRRAVRRTAAACLPGTPGRLVRAAEGGVAVACGQLDADARGLVLLRVRPDGQDALPAADFFGTFGGYLQ
ncbi:MAG: formyltransferase family protein, partial [Pseudonocardiaceae bacterium]